MNPELKERSQEQIAEQRIAVLQERFREDMLKSPIVRHTALKFLIRYYMKKIIYWSGITLGFILLFIIIHRLVVLNIL